MTSGNRFTIRNDGEVIYVEVELTDAQRKAGRFISMELRKSKDGYSGKEHSVLVGWKRDRSGNEKIINSCVSDYDVEASTVSDRRFEGRILVPPPNSTVDFKNCHLSQAPEWQKFVWIPE